MELKDVILSTLEEMENVPPVKETSKKTDITKIKQKEAKSIKNTINNTTVEETSSDSEMIFLTSIRERLLVLFEGFQAPNNANIEAKVDMTLNFLEYTLVNIDARIEKLEKGQKK